MDSISVVKQILLHMNYLLRGFMMIHRTDPPDVDVDFETEFRERVIDFYLSIVLGMITALKSPRLTLT